MNKKETEVIQETKPTHAAVPINIFNEIFRYIISKPMGEVEELVKIIRENVQTTVIGGGKENSIE